MDKLTSPQARVLGVLIEKSTTTPDQYPLSLNGLTAGANQKSNRDPVTEMTDDECFDAAESLRGIAVVVRVDQMGGRVHKYRHALGDVLNLRPAEMALLAEMLLRGPQTVGELRTRAARIVAMDSTDAVQNLLTGLEQRDPPLVRQMRPAPGSRASKYCQLLTDEPIEPARPPAGSAPGSVGSPPDLERRVADLEADVAELKQSLAIYAGRAAVE